MFDIGWQEFILIALVAVVVIGPKDLPRVIRTVGQWVRKARSLASEFQGSLEEMAREAELDDVRRQVQSISREGIGASFEKHVDPTGEIRRSVEEAQAASGAHEIEEALEDVRSDTQALARPAAPAPLPAPSLAPAPVSAPTASSSPVPAPASSTPLPSVTSSPSTAAVPPPTPASGQSGKAAETPKAARKAPSKRTAASGASSEKATPKKATATNTAAKPRRATKKSSGAEAGEA